MRKTVRTSISISSDLKKRMDQIEEDVNWSAVASRAFEAKLAEIGRTRFRPTVSTYSFTCNATAGASDG